MDHHCIIIISSLYYHCINVSSLYHHCITVMIFAGSYWGMMYIHGGQFFKFVDCGFSVNLWGCNNMDVSVFSFSKITNSFKICFHQRCKFVGEGYWATMNFNDSTIINQLLLIIINCISYFITLHSSSSRSRIPSLLSIKSIHGWLS